MAKSTVIIPKKLSVDPRKMALAITNTMNAVALDIKTDFAVTVQTWSNKPTFAIASPTVYTRTIGTDGAIYTMLNKGTKPHIIRPKAGGVLVFRTPFQSKTLPRQIASGPGRKGSNVVRARVVHHPGTAAREWDTTIAEKWQRLFPGVMQRAIDAAVR